MNTNIIKNYRDQDDLRHSFNALAAKTFDGLSFEAWYQAGYWGDRYNPHSIVIDGVVAANVSVNTIDFIWNGGKKRLIQLGTVMTEECFRNQGLIRRIMQEIDREYAKDVDGFYLFANDSVLDFYPKFGFRKVMEYRYTKPFSTSKECSMIKVPMSATDSSCNPARRNDNRSRLADAMSHGVSYSRFRMVDNDNLMMFYATGFMQDNVYYSEKYDTYVIADIEGDTLMVHDVFSEVKHSLDNIFAAFGPDIRQIVLGFTPSDGEGYQVSAFREEDCTLFVKGRVFDSFEQDQVIFPTLSHA